MHSYLATQKDTKCCYYVAEGDSADIQFLISEIKAMFICTNAIEENFSPLHELGHK